MAIQVTGINTLTDINDPSLSISYIIPIGFNWPQT